jgi:hypothetical protein
MRIFFDEVIRENLDVGRPDQVQLIFEGRVRKQTPARFRTRVITEGVTPSLCVDYKHPGSRSITSSIIRRRGGAPDGDDDQLVTGRDHRRPDAPERPATR